MADRDTTENHIGRFCPVCKTKIQEGEAVTTCPACKSPHHKYCWEKNRGCAGTFDCPESPGEIQDPNPVEVCNNCGAKLVEAQQFCPKCGTPKIAPKQNVCGNCGVELQEDYIFCPKCGTPKDVPKENVCDNCGTELQEDHIFCPKCGRKVQKDSAQMDTASRALVSKFSARLKTNAIIWLVIGAFQILFGIYMHWVVLIVGVLNLISAAKDFRFSKNVLQNPNGIVSYVQSLSSPILTLIYNIVCGAVIGVVGSIYYLVAIRGFVMENEPYFQAIENDSP